MRSRDARFIAAAAMLGMVACGQGSDAPPGANPDDSRHTAIVVRAAIEVDEVEAGTSRLRRSIARHDGYVQSASTSEHASVIARIPVARLDAFRQELRVLGEVRSESEESEDVTEQERDQGARLRNARREEERLLALMSERTATLSDVIAIEERLGVVRERIEQLEAAERSITQRVELAEVHVELSPRAVPFWRDPLATLASAGAWGLEAAAAIVVGATVLVAGLGPTALIFATLLALAILAVRGVSRRRARA